jgi:Fe-S cluster assembly protein SufD
VTSSAIAVYRDRFTAFSNNGGGEGPAWLPALRRQAFDRFNSLGFPTTRDEDFHYTSVAPIAESSFGIAPAARSMPSASALADLMIDESWSRLVFINGRLAGELSVFTGLPEEVEVSTLENALAEEPAFVESRLGAVAETDRNAFAALNTAFVAEGAVIRVPDGCEIGTPIHIMWLSDAAASGNVSFPRLLIEVGTHGRVSVVESFASIGGSAYFTNAVTEITLADGARADHYKLQREAPDAFHVSTAQATQGRDSILHAFSFAAGARLSRTNVYTKLGAPGGEARLNGLYLLDGQQHCDHQTFVHHAAESCASRELYKGILDESSHGVFNGKVLVDAIAQKTDGKQTNHALLLSEHAKIDTKPQLEIFADDVKCTHGATVGRLDDTALFYLKSRGVGADMARALLTYAFAADVLETIEDDTLREALKAMAFERYNVSTAA